MTVKASQVLLWSFAVDEPLPTYLDYVALLVEAGEFYVDRVSADAVWNSGVGVVEPMPYAAYREALGMVDDVLIVPPDIEIPIYRFDVGLLYAVGVNIRSAAWYQRVSGVGGFPVANPYLPAKYPT